VVAMKKLCLFTSKATSLRNVGRDIAYVARKHGYVPRLFNYTMPPFEVKKYCTHVVYIMTYSPVWATHWVLNAYEVYRKGKGLPVIFYGTVEGKPKWHLMHEWMAKLDRYVANSIYTRQKLEEAGLPVLDVVYHGVNPETVSIAKGLVENASKQLKSKVKEKVVFMSVSPISVKFNCKLRCYCVFLHYTN